MTDQLIDGKVIPYPHGRRENDSRLWRDATDLELEQAARIEELEQQQDREWVGLTDEERYLGDARSEEEIEYARAIEAKLKEKNNG